MQLKVWTEEDIVKAAYTAAEVVYNKKLHVMKSLRISLDDFKQDAAIHILAKYREGYFFIKEKPEPIIYTFLNNWFVRNIIGHETRRLSRISSLDANLGNDDNFTLSRFLTSDELGPDEMDKIRISSDLGKAAIDRIVDKLDANPYKTRKHRYIGFHEQLGKIKLSENNLGKLILEGNELHDILDIYGEDRVNSGGSSTSSYIASKVKKTKEKLIDMLSNLSKEEKLDIQTYLSKK